MDGIDIVSFGRLYDMVNVEVAVAAGSLAYALCLIGLVHMTRQSVGRAVNSHRADAHLIAATHDAYCYFSTISN